MNPWLLASATVFGIVAALLLYLASPQQQWRSAGALPARRTGWIGSACALFSLALITRALAPLESVFAWSVLLMFVWSIAPFLGAWRRRARAERAR